MQDRRPITPPPCIRLVVKDVKTHKELDIKSVVFDSTNLGFVERILDGCARAMLKSHL